MARLPLLLLTLALAGCVSVASGPSLAKVSVGRYVESHPQRWEQLELRADGRWERRTWADDPTAVFISGGSYQVEGSWVTLKHEGKRGALEKLVAYRAFGRDFLLQPRQIDLFMELAGKGSLPNIFREKVPDPAPGPAPTAVVPRARPRVASTSVIADL